MNNLQFAIPIDIINDEIHELDENFLGRLSTVDEDAILQPGQTMIHILNDDGKLLIMLMMGTFYSFLSSSFAL